MSAGRSFVRDNALGLAFAAGFLLTLVGQALAGHAQFDEQQRAAGLDGVSLARYVTSASFATDVAENWQSEYLQFMLYVLGTVWLVQRGSPESKSPGEEGRGSDSEQRIGPYADEDSPLWARAGGWRTALYARSLGLAMGVVFLLSWLAQSVAGRISYDEERLHDHQRPLSWGEYVRSSDFWSRTFQNWQSELLAVGSFAVLAVYLRERGSPESKPVGAPHEETGSSA